MSTCVYCLEVSSVDERCTSLQFRCVSSALCIPGAWLCDRTCDCSDCSDECGQSASLQLITDMTQMR